MPYTPRSNQKDTNMTFNGQTASTPTKSSTKYQGNASKVSHPELISGEGPKRKAGDTRVKTPIKGATPVGPQIKGQPDYSAQCAPNNVKTGMKYTAGFGGDVDKINIGYKK